MSCSGAGQRFLVLGPSEGWHAEQLRKAVTRRGHSIDFQSYESIAASVGGGWTQSGADQDRQNRETLDAQGAHLFVGRSPVVDVDAILTRTMPWSSLERITFRLSAIRAFSDGLLAVGGSVANEVPALERCIDKYATLLRLAALGFPTPGTRVVQNRSEAMEAFEAFGGDCVVKPLFGGEGRGVMRVSDRELAWYTFSSLDRLDAAILIQQFVHPGGSDRRLLVVGDRVFGLRRSNPNCFRSNVAAGGKTERIDVDPLLAEDALTIVRSFGLVYGAIDLIDNASGPDLFLEINAIPGWKGAQQVINESIADCLIDAMTTPLQRNAS